MRKVKFRLILLGQIPYYFDWQKIKDWKSELFELTGSIDTLDIIANSDGRSWQYSDRNIESQLPDRNDENILLAVTNVIVENNYLIRMFSDDRMCLSYNDMIEILTYSNIPLENLLLRVLYAASLDYRIHGNRISSMDDLPNLAHHDTRGCIFDMDGNKSDAIYSTNKPKICDSCVELLASNQRNRIERNLINTIQSELKKIRKPRYVQITEFIKLHPILAIIISSITAIILGAVGSIIASSIYKK